MTHEKPCSPYDLSAIALERSKHSGGRTDSPYNLTAEKSLSVVRSKGKR